MKNNKITAEGSHSSITYRKDRKKWEATYYIKDYINGKNIRKRRTFPAEKDAKDFIKSIEYQKENPIFIEKNGIPLVEIMKLNVNRKKEMNIISDTQRVYNKVWRF